MDTSVELTKAAALARMAAPKYNGLLYRVRVAGDADPALVREVLGVPPGGRRFYQAQAINASDATVLALDESVHLLTVGPNVQPVTPRLHVGLPGEWLTFEADGRVFRQGVTDADTTPLGSPDASELLVNFDGHSVTSSLARTTAPRRELLEQLAGGAVPAREVRFAYRGYGWLSNLCLVAGVVGTALFTAGLVYPDAHGFLFTGLAGLVLGALAYVGMRQLRSFLGLRAVGIISRL